MTIKPSRWIVCVLFILTCVSAVRSHAATIRGTTVDAATEEAVGFVTVQVFTKDAAGADISRGAMSLGDGNYVMPNVPLGRYLIRFSRIGYALLEDSITVDTDGDVFYNARLTEQAVVIDEVVVEADRIQPDQRVIPGLIDIKATDLASLPGIIEGDPIRSLQLLPGVQAASDISSGLYVRGGGPDQTLVLLDNVTVYNPTHAFGFFSTFNADALDDVNLYKGAYPAQYGGRLGSVLDISSRDGNKGNVRGSGGLSTVAGRLVLEGGGPQETTWLLSGRRTFLEPLLDALRSPDNEIPEYYFYDFNGRIDVPTAGGTFTLSGYYGWDDLFFDLDTDSKIALGWGNRVGTAAYRRLLSETVLWRTRLSGSQYRNQAAVEFFSTPISFANRLRDISLTSDLTWTPNRQHKLRFGVAGSLYDFRYVESFNLETDVSYDRSPREAATFLEDEWTPDDRTVVKAGVRARYINDGKRFLVEPRGAVSRKLGDAFRAKVGAGIYHQYLQLVSTEGFSAADFYLPIDKTADVPRSWQLVGGLEYEPTIDYKVSLETYYTQLEDVVEYDNNAPVDVGAVTADDVFVTEGEGYQTGVELFVQKRTGALTGWVGYTLGWTRRQFDSLNDGKVFAPKYDRRNDVNVVASYKRGKWSYGTTFVYGSGQAFTPASARYVLTNPATGTVPGDAQLLPAERNSARLLPYHRMDVSISRDATLFSRDVEWFVQVFNVYSRRNEWFVQYNTSDAQVQPEVVKQLPIIPSIGINFRF